MDNMFTGLIQHCAKVVSCDKQPDFARFGISLQHCSFKDSVVLGESIAINGVCLTVQRLQQNCFYADVSHETLAKTSLRQLDVDHEVNIERSLTASSLMGGHIVTGHVDAVGELQLIEQHAKSIDIVVAVPNALMRYIAVKGSLTVDGISLTVAAIELNLVRFCIIPHTWQCTNLKARQINDPVNIEVDILARYCERLIDSRNVSKPATDAEVVVDA